MVKVRGSQRKGGGVVTDVIIRHVQIAQVDMRVVVGGGDDISGCGWCKRTDTYRPSIRPVTLAIAEGESFRARDR